MTALGASLVGDSVTFSVWAPRCRTVDAVLEGRGAAAPGAPALADLVLDELHVGAFTPAGTFEAIVPHLAALVDLGVTALELMPVCEFPGSRNWGYDGVHLFPPQPT